MFEDVNSMTKFALFGAGLIGRIHGSNIATHPRAKLQYVYDINIAAAEQLAFPLGAKIASSPEEIWEADDVDAFLIASSTNTHAPFLTSPIPPPQPLYSDNPTHLNIRRAKTLVPDAYHA